MVGKTPRRGKVGAGLVQKRQRWVLKLAFWVQNWHQIILGGACARAAGSSGCAAPAVLLVPGTPTQRWQQGTEPLGQQQLPEELA